MAQEQPRMPVSGRSEDDAVKYGDVFEVEGELADETIKPRDATMMQAAENRALGKTSRDGAAALMQAAADWNEQAGLVDHDQVSSPAKDQGVDVSQDDAFGARIVTESVAGHTVAQYAISTGFRRGTATATGGNRADTKGGLPASAEGETADHKTGGETADYKDAVTIGEALESVSGSAANKPVNQKDASAVMAGETRAIGSAETDSGGVAAQAQSAAAANAGRPDELKTKLGEVTSDATRKLPRDKPATRDDATRVAAAEMSSDMSSMTHAGGVADAVRSAASLNRDEA